MLGIILIHSVNIGMFDLSSPHTVAGVRKACEVEVFMNRYVLAPLVPLFFLISGFLFNRGNASLSAASYLGKLKSRIRTLVVPYVLWNVFAYIVRNIIKMTPLGARYCSDTAAFGSFSMYEMFIEPSLVPLWFLRNLILLVLLVPAIYFLIKRFGGFSLLLFVLAEMFGGEYMAGILYFSGGIYLSICCRGINPDSYVRFFKVPAMIWGAAILLLFILQWFGHKIDMGGLGLFTLCLKGMGDISMAILGMTFYLWSFSNLVERKPLAQSAFFIYAFHGIISPYVIKIINIIHPDSFIGVIGCYFADFVCIAVVSICAFFVVKSIFPRLLWVLTGGRG